MAKLSYSTIASLDGFIADEAGNFDWAAPDEELHAYVNDLERTVGTYLYGRRMYETMRYWETAHLEVDQPPVMLDYASIWQAAEKVVYSTSLNSVPTARTRLENHFDVESVRSFKQSAERDISIGGAGLAAEALRAGLVDEIHLFLTPVLVGGGTRCLPAKLRTNLDLIGLRRFDGGVVELHYRVRT